MRNIILTGALLLFSFQLIYAQQVVSNQTPCTDKDVQSMPALYYNHTKPKYGNVLSGTRDGFTTADISKITNTLNSIEKLEESSRKNLQATGCVMRVSYSTNGKNNYIGYTHKQYGYQLGLYQMVCNVQQHVVKEVGEYRTVLRVTANPSFMQSPLNAGTGGLVFNKTPNSIFWTYNFPADARLGVNYEKDRTNKPTAVSTYFSEASLLQGRSDNYKDYHTDFLKINNGNGYVENWQGGNRYANHGSNSYQFIDRHYLITQPGIPLMIPVSRKQYIKDMLEYIEVEKANFNYTVDDMIQKSVNDNSDFGKQKKQTWQANKAAYAEIYEARKAKLNELLITQKEDWLQQQAIVAAGNKTKDANDRLKETGKFYDKEAENVFALYVLNPAYWSRNVSDPVKPVLFEIQFRYEIADGRNWSENLLKNFEKNFDVDALRKMIE